MEDILYVKVEQNMVVQKKTLTYEDIATLYCQNQNIVKKLNKEIFYTLDPKQQKTMFTIERYIRESIKCIRDCGSRM